MAAMPMLAGVGLMMVCCSSSLSVFMKETPNLGLRMTRGYTGGDYLCMTGRLCTMLHENWIMILWLQLVQGDDTSYGDTDVQDDSTQ